MSKFDTLIRVRGIVLAFPFLTAGLVGSCSEASGRLHAWPGSPSIQTDSTTDGSVDKDSDEEERSKDEDSMPDSSEGVTETSSSNDDNEASREYPSSESTSALTSESSDQSSSSDESSDQGSSDPLQCIQTLCFETNTSQKARGYPSDAGQVIFRLFVKEGMKRLARIELVEGFSQEPTTVVFKKNGENKHGDLLAEVSWSDRPSDHLDWVGADFDEPIDIEGERVIWVEVSPADGEFFSLSDSGKRLPMWHRWFPASSWIREPAPVMFRAYCCEE